MGIIRSITSLFKKKKTTAPQQMTSSQASLLGLQTTSTPLGTAYTTSTSTVSGIPKTTTPTTTTKTGGGSSGGGGSSNLVSTPSGVITEQQYASQTTVQKQADISRLQAEQRARETAIRGFSGSVQELESSGGVAREEFYVRGKQTGEVFYKGGRPSEARTITPSRFTFDRDEGRREIVFTPEGAEETQYRTQVVQQRQQTPAEILFGGGFERETSYALPEGGGYEVTSFGGIKEINPQGFSYQDPLTKRGYEVTRFTEKKLKTEYEKKYPRAISLTKFNEMYYGTQQKISAISSKITSFPERFSSPEVLELNLIYRQQKETRAREKFMNAPFVSKLSPEKQEYWYGASKQVAVGTTMALIPFPASKVPLRIVSPERALAKVSISKEVSLSAIKGGKQIRIGSYVIRTEVQPPRTILIRKQGQGLLDAKMTYMPSQYIKTTTPFNVVGEKPFTTFSAKNVRYGKVIGVERVSPVDTKFISPAEYSALPKSEKFLLQRMVEVRIGKPVAQKLVPKFLSQEKIYVRSTFDVTKTGRVAKVKAGEYDVLKPLVKQGATTRKFLTISEVTEKGEQGMFNFYKVDTLFKDVTKPLSRATGKTPRMITKGAELKEPIVFDVTKDVGFVSPATITKTPMSKTFAEQVVRQSFLKAFPKIPRQLRMKAVTQKPSAITSVVPAIAISQSAYYGKGMYERTEGGLVPSFKLPSLIEQPIQKEISISSTFFKEQPAIKVKPESRGREQFKEETKLIFREELLPKTEVIMKEQPKLKEIEIQKVLQKQKLIQKQKMMEQRFPSGPRIIKPREPKPKEEGWWFPRLKIGKSLFSGRGKFPVFLRRFGKFKIIGYGKTEKQAFDIGRGAATRTLGATFKVPTAKYQPTSIKGFTTKQTKEGTLFIEMPKYRLSKKQEKEEIQMFKKLKGGKRK